MPKPISVVAARPGKQPEIMEIENDLQSMQDFVEGYIETVALERGAILVCNEEGRIRGMRDNRAVPGVGMIKGPFFICSSKGADFASLSEKNAEKYLNILKTGADRPKGPRLN